VKCEIPEFRYTPSGMTGWGSHDIRHPGFEPAWQWQGTRIPWSLSTTEDQNFGWPV